MAQLLVKFIKSHGLRTVEDGKPLRLRGATFLKLERSLKVVVPILKTIGSGGYLLETQQFEAQRLQKSVPLRYVHVRQVWRCGFVGGWHDDFIGL